MTKPTPPSDRLLLAREDMAWVFAGSARAVRQAAARGGGTRRRALSFVLLAAWRGAFNFEGAGDRESSGIR